MHDLIVIGRRAVLLAASTAYIAPKSAESATVAYVAAAVSDEQPAVVPLFLCGGAYCAAYQIDKQPFRAVIDTGSPFMLVDGTCGRGALTEGPWGCYRGAARDAGLDDTDEIYGGQDVGVEWRRCLDRYGRWRCGWWW